MAESVLKPNHHNTVYHIVGLFLLLIQRAHAREFKVGGSGWHVPSNSNVNSYNEWAEQQRFQVQDSLVFEYPAGKDSVALVDKDAYTNCSATHLQSFSDGHTVYTLKHSGPYYFISGIKDNCLKNEKLVVVVMADRSQRTPPPAPSLAPTPAPAVNEPPPPAGPPPPTLMNPTPAPAVNEPPPPAGPPPTTPMNPTPAPESPTSPNAASPSFMISIGSFGALAASSFFLVS